MYQLLAGKGFQPADAQAQAFLMTVERAFRRGIIHAYIMIMEGILTKMGIPKAQWGPYIAFVNEFASKILKEKTYEIPDVVDKWVKNYHLDPIVVRKFLDLVGEVIETSPEF